MKLSSSVFYMEKITITGTKQITIGQGLYIHLDRINTNFENSIERMTMNPGHV